MLNDHKMTEKNYCNRSNYSFGPEGLIIPHQLYFRNEILRM